jgi:murein DD-endopeptidase MepM/ murein hydrolase activator NlpD
LTNEDQKAVTAGVVRVLRALGLASLYARFVPKVRRGNQPDMGIVTTNRIWFLRENQFLVFTRGGPVELTLKPSLVLTGILICMAGVAAIFYSTIIASFSAIEVMRDETIKTAQASANPKINTTISKDNAAIGALRWLDYKPVNLGDFHPPAIAGKIAQTPSLTIGRSTAQPAVTAPQIPQTLPNAKIAEDNAVPLIIQGGKRITLASKAESGKPQFGDNAKSIVNKPRANAPSSPKIMPILVPAGVLKPKNDAPIIAEQSLADQKMAEITVSEENLITETDAKKADAKQTDIKEMGIDQNLVTAAINPKNGNNGQRVILASNAESGKPQFGDDAKSIAIKPGANAPSSPKITPILAPAVVLSPKNNAPIVAEQSLTDQKMAKTTVSEENLITKTDAKKADAKQTDIKEMGIDQNLVTAAISPIIGNDGNPASITAHAQEFTIALLPDFASAPKDRKTVRRQLDENNGDAVNAARLSPPSPKLPEQHAVTTAALPAAPDVPQADGLLTGFFTQRQGPVLPLVTEAARTKKVLLALEQEIEYIRATVIGLGISAEALPSPIQLATIAKDDDFKNIMVNLAEHRAALRKIPFKPPMLYFYISSDYGNRKHPKTGKIAFHHGVDLAGTWQENVRVTAPGTVIYAGTEGSFGKVVRVQHDFGIVTTYAHLARITVRLGDYIGENHVIGKMGNTGRSAGAHLHYEVRVNNKSIDPVKFMIVGRQISVAGELRQSNLID